MQKVIFGMSFLDVRPQGLIIDGRCWAADTPYLNAPNLRSYAIKSEKM